jgi:hypothetical protein
MDRVLALCDRLRADGVDAWIDQYETAPPEGWPRWCARRVAEADFVLVVCTELYERRFRGDEAPDTGLGARWEGYIVVQELYDAGALNARYIPVLWPPAGTEHVPLVLRGATRHDFSRVEAYQDLYQYLTGQPKTPAPPLGKRVAIPPRERRAADPAAGKERRGKAPTRGHEEPTPPAPESLQISPKITYLTRSYPEISPTELLEIGFLGRAYAVLSVCNEGNLDLPRVVARCFVASSGETAPCFWSKEPGKDFTSGGNVAADLYVWQDRLLVIAQVFGQEKLWARLPADQRNLFLPPAIREGWRSLGGAYATSQAGEELDLGKNAELIVRFRAEGLEVVERRFLLGFDSEGPTISITSTTSAGPAPSRPSG